MTLPDGWIEAQASEVCEIVQSGGTPKEGFCETPGVPFLKVYNLVKQQVSFAHRPQFVTHTIHSSQLAKSRAVPGDVIMNIVGPPLGKVGVIPKDFPEWNLNQALTIFRPGIGTTTEWLYHLLRSGIPISSILRETRGIAGQVNISLSQCRDLIFPLPPLAEQGRIVAKLDALTARLARARADLDRIPALAEHMRRAVLTRAFGGALTAHMRPADNVDASSPVSWQVRELGEISEIQGGIQVGKKRPQAATLVEVPYLRVANVQRGWLKLDEIKTLGVTPEEREKLTLRPGDILMNEGGDRDKLGRGWVWQAEVAGCIHQNHVFRIRLHNQNFPPEFVSHYANEFGQPYFIDQGTQTTNLASISKRKVAALPVPVPPADEAREIVRLISEAFAHADRMEAEAARARALLDRLEAAILARAFRGELVPQDPADEPASALLDRIRAQRAASPEAKRGRRTTTKAVA